jgi:hypothetical protein
MLQLSVLAVGLLLGLYLLVRGVAGVDPRRLARVLKVAGIVAGVALVLFLAVSGRLVVLLGLLPMLVPLWQRWRAARQVRRGPTPGRSSSVETAWLRMVLDHDSGAMSGEVLQGRLRGREVGDLELPQLLALLAECRAADPQSAQLLQAYLDRTHPDWQDQEAGGSGTAGSGGEEARAAGPPPRGGMSTEEAWQVLGLAPGAGAGEIKEAHRRLMLRNHPDQGGSTYLAAKINQAKDTLLADRARRR